MNKSYLFQEIILKNPVLVGTIGLCPVVAICTSLKSAVIMSVITILTLIVAQALSSLVFKRLPQWLRMGLYMLVGMAIVLPSIAVLEKISSATMLALGIYLPLLSVNPIIVRQCEREGVKITLSEAFKNSLCAGVGYSLVLLVVGLCREFLGSGTIWGFTILPVAPAPSFLMPMGGFVMIAFLAALLRVYFKKIDPQYAEELAFNSRTAIKKNRNMKSVLLDIEEEKAVESVPEPVAVEEVIAVQEEPLTEAPAEEPKEELKAEVSAETEKVAEPADVPAPAENKAPKKKRSASKAKSAPAKKTSKKKETVEAAEVVEPPVEHKQKFEFITLDLPSSKMPKPAEEKPAETKTPEAVPEPEAKAEPKKQKPTGKKAESKIVYRSEELEKLMSLSLDDIINGLPDTDGEESAEE